MKHCKKGRKLGRKRDQKKALLKTLAVNLILNEKIKTTEAKAKEVRPFIEKLITKSRATEISKEGDDKSVSTNNLSIVKSLARCLPKEARKKMIKEIGPRYHNRAGGYTRIVKLGPRKGDSAKMAIIEFVK